MRSSSISFHNMTGHMATVSYNETTTCFAVGQQIKKAFNLSLPPKIIVAGRPFSLDDGTSFSKLVSERLEGEGTLTVIGLGISDEVLKTRTAASIPVAAPITDDKEAATAESKETARDALAFNRTYLANPDFDDALKAPLLDKKKNTLTTEHTFQNEVPDSINS